MFSKVLGIPKDIARHLSMMFGYLHNPTEQGLVDIMLDTVRNTEDFL